ncbi:hypothetical protein TNCV_921361 [Trichonephila clavipes]|nr:hypothetical protein TNCV_921361 [Trichonephila clavipes]
MGQKKGVENSDIERVILMCHIIKQHKGAVGDEHTNGRTLSLGRFNVHRSLLRGWSVALGLESLTFQPEFGDHNHLATTAISYRGANTREAQNPHVYQADAQNSQIGVVWEFGK